MGFGEDLKGRIQDIDTYTNNGISYLKEAKDYLTEKIAIETQCAASLEKLAKSYLKGIKKNSFYGVGTGFTLESPEDEPKSTISKALVGLFSEDEKAAQLRLSALELATKEVVEKFKMESKRVDERRAAHLEYYKKLTGFLEQSKSDAEKLKSSYWSSAKDLDSIYARFEKVDEKSYEKIKKEWNEAYLKKQDKKNDYILGLFAHNDRKDKYYNHYVPKVMDYLEELNQFVISKSQDLFTHYLTIVNSSLSQSMSCTQEALDKVTAIEPQLDTSYFSNSIKHPWSCPSDVLFEGFSTSDRASVSVEVSDAYLLNELLELQQLVTDSELFISNQRKTMEGIQSLKDSYFKDPSLGDYVDVLEKYIEAERHLFDKEIQKHAYESKIRSIREVVGQITLKPHTFKNTSSGKCVVCDGSLSLFGKGLKCSECMLKAHHNCLSKLAPLCGTPYIPPNVFNPSNSGTQLTRSVSKLSKKRISTVSSRLYKGKVKVLFDFVGEDEDALKVKEGDIIDVIEYDDGNGWLKGSFKGVEGVVPANYVERIEGAKKSPSMPTISQQVTALYDYVPQNESELELKQGDIINLIKKDEDGWWTGEINGKTGQFPGNYVEEIKE